MYLSKRHIVGVVALIACKAVEAFSDTWDSAAEAVEYGVIAAAGVHLARRAIDYCRRVNRAVMITEGEARPHGEWHRRP
ncbi:hypothetical protein AB0940_00920 [Streptomyces sp. NPDC006656]|uniref:hypothetical protein n=1 Tax=Streptomyces sp. NPDC006656 TaxID=3156899 RepID=UPI0034551A8F